MRIGDVDVARVLEFVGPLAPVGTLFPQTPDDVWTDVASDFWDPSTRAYRGALQTWVLRSSGRTVLVDTGAGNGRHRPQAPALAGLNTDYLDALARAGVDPAEVDVVVNTHVHYDHVGWNTRRVDETWVPTFPNATYLVPQRDLDYFDPATGNMRAPRTDDERRRFEGIALVWADSIAPVIEAGQVQGWDDEHRVDDRLRLVRTDGHTPGSSVLWLESGDGAAFVGDLLHSPVQFHRPDDVCAFDLDADRARRSRRDVLADVARTGATIFPAHLPGHGATTLRPDGEAYAIERWSEFDPV